VHVDQSADNVQAQADAAVLAAGRSVDLVERLGDVGKVGFSDADAIVGDDQRQTAGRIRLGGDSDVAAVGLTCPC
jgi:hypothetical protein